jgi:hypothetical protein
MEGMGRTVSIIIPNQFRTLGDLVVTLFGRPSQTCSHAADSLQLVHEKKQAYEVQTISTKKTVAPDDTS